MTLLLWQNDNPNCEIFIASGPSPGYYNWEPITTIQNLANGIVFFFQVHDLSGSGDMFGSHYFNLTASSATSTTSSRAATSTTASATTAAAATSADTASDSAQSSSSSSGGMSSSTKAGIGVGVGVGVPLIAAIGFGFFLLGRQKARRNVPPLANDTHDGKHGLYPRAGVGLQEISGNQVHEMPAQYQAHELPGQDVRAELPTKHGQ
ncbi:hypothetical protein LPUS_02208 [Lasallia pustulata]|uniref:Mid2 domain-containing protein n=1 Tax=Lasallia pustulata TaxID=136370 RepID=A0A1W5CS77_9LECA|nr:hypothetical protein LPUS_02208 [Lasallia pustulata]